MLMLNLLLFPSCRDTQPGQEQPIRGEGAPHGNSTVRPASGTKLTGSITMVTEQEDNRNPAVPRLQQIHQPQQHLQQIHVQQHLRQSPLHLQPPPHSQQQRGAGLLQPPHMPRLPNQPFSHAPMLAPLSALGGISSLLGPTPVWSGGLGPSSSATLVWGFQQAGRDFTGPRLLGGYHNPAGQGSNRYRGGQRGGGFNGT